MRILTQGTDQGGPDKNTCLDANKDMEMRALKTTNAEKRANTNKNVAGVD